MADAKNTLGHALLQAFGLDDQRVKRLSLNIEAGDAPLLTVTVYPRDVSAQQIEAIATEYEIISRSELRDIRERLAAVQQAEPVQSVAWVDERAISWLAGRRNKASAHVTTTLSAAKSLERPMALYTAPQQQAEPVAWRSEDWKIIVPAQFKSLWPDAKFPLYEPPQQAEPVHPSGFAYRYPDGVRFNDGCEVNGCLPSEVIPYYFGKAPPKAEPVQDQTRSREAEHIRSMALARDENWMTPDEAFDKKEES